MKNKFRSAFFKLLDYLPSSLGFNLYHAVQQRFTASFQTKYEANEKSFTEMQRILHKASFSTQNKSILEIGSGWMPLMPYHFKVDGGCEVVHTYDINDHYQNKYIDQLNEHYRRAGRASFEVAQKGLHLPDFVKYYPHSNVITASLPKKVDIIFSRFVLEHVTPTDMLAMHRRFVKEYGSEVLILHLISPSDHRAFSDSSVSHYDFLQYSEKQWNRIQTKFDYHNRLRLPQYLEIFKQAGMEILHLEYDSATPGTAKWEKYKRLKIHADYQQMTDEERTAGSINVLLRSKQS